MAMRAFVDGEHWSLLILEDGELKIRALDPQQIDNALSRELPSGGAIVAGVEINSRGKIIGYHVFKDWLPGLPLLKGLAVQRIDAADVLHLFHAADGGTGSRRLEIGERFVAAARTRPACRRAARALQDRRALGGLYHRRRRRRVCRTATVPGECSLEPGTLQRLKPGESVSFSATRPISGKRRTPFKKPSSARLARAAGFPVSCLRMTWRKLIFRRRALQSSRFAGASRLGRITSPFRCCVRFIAVGSPSRF